MNAALLLHFVVPLLLAPPPDLDARLAALSARPTRASAVAAVREAVVRRELTFADATLALTDAEIAAWSAEDAAARAALAAAAEARRALAGSARPSGAAGTQQALALAALESRGGAVTGRLDERTAAGLVVLAVGDPARAPGLGWAAAMPAAAREKLRDRLVSGDLLDDRTLGRGVAAAVSLGGVFLKPLVQGIVLAPGLGRQPERQAAAIAALVDGLAELDYDVENRWDSVYFATTRPFLVKLLDDGRPAERRAAATFAVARVARLGHLDRVAKDAAGLAIERTAALPMFLRAAYELHRRAPAPSDALLALGGASLQTFPPEGPWDLRHRLRLVAEEHCGALPEPTRPPEPERPAPPEDPRLAEERRIVREGTAKIRAALDAFKGTPTEGLSYRRCESWLKVYDIERFGSPERRAALDQALTCLQRHVAQWSGHAAARLDLARVLDDAGRTGDALDHLALLVDATDERSRVLGSYRLLTLLSPGGGPGDAFGRVPRSVAEKAARTVADEGFTPQQRAWSAMVLAWLAATGGRPEAAYDQLEALAQDVWDSDDGTSTFPHLGGILDTLDKVALMAKTPPSHLIGLYRTFSPAVRQSALLQLAHLFARDGLTAALGEVAAELEREALGPEAALLLADARLRELGPESRDAAGQGLRTFDPAESKVALAQLRRIDPLLTSADPDVATAASCVALGYAQPLAFAMAESGQLAPAAELLKRAAATSKGPVRTAILLQLADVLDRLRRPAEALAALREALAAEPDLVTQRPLLVFDYYELAHRAGAAADLRRAAELLGKSASAVVVATLSAYPAGRDRTATLDRLRAILALEGHFAALQAVADLLEQRGEPVAARAACASAQRGLLFESLDRAGLKAYVVEGTGPLDGPKRCEDAVRRPATRAAESALKEAVAHAEKAAQCAGPGGPAGEALLVASEAQRILGDLDSAQATLGRARQAGAGSEAADDVAERIGWSSLLAGRLEAAERLLSAASPAARFWAGHVALAAGRPDVAASRFAAAGGATDARLWEARARLAAGDVEGWRAILADLAELGDPAALRAVLAEIDAQAQTQPQVAEALWAELAPRLPAAQHHLTLAGARKKLEADLRPLARTKTRSAPKAVKALGRLVKQLDALRKSLEPVLAGGGAATLIEAVEVMVGGLTEVYGYLAAHEPLIGRSGKNARIVNGWLDGLEAKTIDYGRQTLDAAHAQAFTDAGLRRLVSRLARRFPDAFGASLVYAPLCEDELPPIDDPGARSGVPAALGALVQKGHAALAGPLGFMCADAAAAASPEWQSVRLAALAAAGSAASPEAVSRAVADVARDAERGVSLSASVRLALAGRFAGVDCKRAQALVLPGDPVPPALARALAACADDRAALSAALEAEAATGSPRAMLRLADLLAAQAGEVDRTNQLIKEAAAKVGRTPEAATGLPICDVPSQR